MTTTKTKKAPDAGRQVRETAKKVQQELLESAHKVWLAGLGALSTVGEEGDRLFRDLVEKGRTMEARGKEEAGEVREKVESRVKDVRGRVEERMRGARKRVEKRFDSVWGAVDDRVADVLHRVGVPTRDEIQRLTRRVEELNAKIDRLRGKPAGAAKAAAKAPAKKASEAPAN
jgi:poly(hydroxyalkanoate) granule-associated protein